MTDLLLRNAPIVGGGAEPVDIALADGVISAVGPGLDAAGAEVHDLDGRWVMPGLWDHHVHFALWARTRRRFDVSGAASAAAVCAAVGARIAAQPGAADTLVAVGFRDALWPDQPTTEALDAAAPGRPVVVLSADLHSAWVNTAASSRFGLPHSGLLRETEAFALQRRLEREPDDDERAMVADAARAAAGRGVVGIVDLEMDDNVVAWARHHERGVRELRVRAGFYADLLDTMIERGLRTGDDVAGAAGMVAVGPLKIIADGSLNTRTAYCHDAYPGTADHGVISVPPAELNELLARAHAHGIHAAVHAIGDLANQLALDAFEATGARGSVEHAQLISPADLARFAALGVTASVQPEHMLDDRDVADTLWSGRTDRAFPLADLAAAGVRLALGSDAPVAPLDPWVAIAAATERARDGREPWHPEQRLTRAQALAASVGTDLAGRPATLAPGARADLAILDADPLTCDAATLRAMPVATTLLAGFVTHSTL